MTSNSNNHNSPTTTSNSRTTTANSLHNRALTHEESRNLMSGGTILEDLADNPTALTHTITPIRKEVFTSLFFLIGDSRSVFTSGVRHDSAEAMSLLTTILNPRGPFARSAVAQELCTFIASIGLSGLRRLRLDRHILSNKDGVAPACVAFITALSIASSDLTASALLCGNSEAESRMKSLASSYARGASTNNNDNNNNFTSSSSSTSMNNRNNNNNANGLGATASSSSSSNLNTNNMNQPDDPLLRRDLQPHETARPHRNQNLRGAPVTPVVPTAGASSSSSNARSSRYAHLPTTPAGQQIAGSNPAYVRGATEVVINLTAASVPSAVRTHARAFGLGGRSAIPKVMMGSDLEKRKCLPLKLIFPGLNDNNNADGGNRGDKTAASAANNEDESSRTTIVTSIHHDPNENTGANDDDNEENARNANESSDNNNNDNNNENKTITNNNNNLTSSVSRVLSNAAQSEFPSSSQVVNRRNSSQNKNRKNNERARRRKQHNHHDSKKNKNQQDRRRSSSKTDQRDRRRNNSHTKNTTRNGNDNGDDDDDDHDQNNKNKSDKQRSLLPDNGDSVVPTSITITNRRHNNNNNNDDDDEEDIVVSPENSHDGDDEYEEYEEYDGEEEEEETSDYTSTDGDATRSDDSRNNSASSYDDDDDEYSSGYEYEEDYESESDEDDDENSSSADDHSSNAEDDDDDDENFRSGSEGENDRSEVQRHEIRTATWLSRQGENERRKDNNKTHRNGNDDDVDDQDGEHNDHNDSRRQQHRQINRIKRDPKRLTRSQRRRRRRRQRRLLQQLEAGTTTTSSANNQENNGDNNNNNNGEVSSPKDKNNNNRNDNDDDGDGERHNVRPIMNVRRQDAREATREAEAAAIKGNTDNKINSPTGKRERRNQPSSLSATTTTTISTNGTSFAQRNETSKNNNNNPEIVSSSSNNSSAFQTPGTRSRKGSFVAAAGSPSLVLPPKNPAFDRQQQQQQQQRPPQLSGSELSPKRISQQQQQQQQLVQQQIVKPLFDRFFTRIVNNNNNNTNSPTDLSSTITVEAAPTSLALAWHTPSSSNPFSSYKIVFAPLKRRGFSVPTLGICCGQKHTVFVVGNGEPQMSNQPPSTLTSLTFPSSPNSPSTSAIGNFSNNNSSTYYNISPSSIMIACSGDNTKSQCGLAASAPIFPGSIENNNHIPNKNSLNSTTSPGSISSSTAAASSQQKTQSQRVQLHSNRQFLSVGSSSRANLVQVLSGSFFSACVTATGEVYLWGDNHYGQCSVGSSLQKKGPLQEQPNKVLFRGNKVTQISCGATFVIALTEADKVLGWGSVHLLGIGTGADSVPCEKTLATSTTTSSANNNNANNSAAAATSSNNNNNSNPLFYLPTESEMQQELIASCSTVPCSIAALCGKQITSIASGNFHSIAVTKAGVLYSWGFGGHGQLGIGTISNSSIPKKLDPSHFSPMQVETVYCGANHSAAVAGGGAALWMWGDNRYGQCGVSMADSSSENFLHNNNNNQDDFLGNKNSNNNNNNNKSANSTASFDSNTGSTSSSSSSRRSPDAAILVPTRVRLNFKQRASIVSVACGNHRTCVLFSDGDVAIWGQQIPFSTFSGGGNCSGYSAGTGYHNVFATPALLTPQLAISQISARYDHIAVNSAKRDFAVITIGMIPGCASGSSGEFGVRIEFLTCAPPSSSTKSTSSGLINGGNHFSPSCSSLLNSWTPLVGLDEGSDNNNNSEFSNSTTTTNNNNQSIASIAAAQHLCFGNPICVGVGGSHTLIGIGYVRSSSQIIVNTTTNSEQNNQYATKQTATTTISSIGGGGGGSFTGTQTESQQNQIIQSCVLSYGTGTWGQLGLGKHLWKFMSSSSSTSTSAFVAPSSPASPSGALQRNSNSNATLSNNSFATSNSSQQNQAAAAAAVSQLCPILFSTSPQVSSPYFHKSSVAPAPPPLIHINSNSPLNKSGSANNSFGQPSQNQNNNNNNNNTPNSPSNANNNNNNTRNAASSAPSNQSANTNSSNNTSTSTSPGVKLTLRGLTCGHAFCFALFSAPVTSSSSSAAGPPSTNLEDTVVYFWGNNNHHQSGVPPPPPTLVNQHLDKVAAMQVKEINSYNNNSGRSPNSDNNNNSNPSEGTTRRGSSSSGEDRSSNGRSSGQSNTSSGGGGDSYPQAPMVATKYDSPVLVPSLSGKGVAQIVAGSFFAMALTSDGNVYAWGLFDCCGLGQFSDFDPEIEGRKRLLRAAGTNYASTQLPPPHASVITTSLTKEQRTCVAFPLRITDKILGEGAYTTNSNHYPASSSNLIVRVAAGPWHAAVLTRRGEVYTWGFGTNHRLGLGADDIRTHLKPVRVALPVRIRDISCGHANTLAISVHDSSLYVWGDNEYGQCGANSASNHNHNHHHSNFSSTAATATSVPEPIKVISNGVRSAAITKTCCIAVMWNGAVLISGILENQNSSSTNNTTTTTTTNNNNNDSSSSTMSIPVSGVISSKNSFVSIQVAVMNALKNQLNQRRAQNSASLLRHQNSSLRAQPGVTVGITNQVLTLFPAPPPTSAFLDDDDDDDDAVGNEDPINTKKTENSNNDQGNQSQQQFEEEEVEMRSFYAHDVVASTQHACLIVEINRPGNSEWNNFRRAVPKLTK